MVSWFFSGISRFLRDVYMCLGISDKLYFRFILSFGKAFSPHIQAQTSVCDCNNLFWQELMIKWKLAKCFRSAWQQAERNIFGPFVVLNLCRSTSTEWVEQPGVRVVWATPSWSWGQRNWAFWGFYTMQKYRWMNLSFPGARSRTYNYRWGHCYKWAMTRQNQQNEFGPA